MSLKAGFGRVDITPQENGVDVTGYFIVRKSEGALDPLEINAVAIELNGKRLIMLAVDTCSFGCSVANMYKKDISDAVGIDEDAVIVSATHTHTGCVLSKDDPRYGSDEIDARYFDFVRARMVEAAKAAIADLKPARVGWNVGKAESVAFGRRFLMKDGTVHTNPGIGNPDIVRSVMEPDQRVNILRFDREGADTILFVNFGNHPDVVGGNLVSADWPGFMRRTLERSIPDTKCIFINGTQGDVNHINVNGKGGYFNDTFNDFDDVIRGYGHARHIGNYMAGSVLQVYDKVNYFEPDEIKINVRTVKVPSNKADPSQLPEAHRINDLHKAGRDDEIPYTGMMLTTVVAEAQRMVQMENGPDYFEMPMTAVSFGSVAFITIPGEGFSGVGIELKKSEGWDVVMPLGLTNGCEGYFPMQDCYDEGGYETRGSKFAPGVAELFIKEGKEMLAEVRDQ